MSSVVIVPSAGVVGAVVAGVGLTSVVELDVAVLAADRWSAYRTYLVIDAAVDDYWGYHSSLTSECQDL
jgi:hypothetical protein